MDPPSTLEKPGELSPFFENPKPTDILNPLSVGELVVWTDGSAHPNPRHSCAAIVVQKPGDTQCETHEFPLDRVASNSRAVNGAEK